MQRGMRFAPLLIGTLSLFLTGCIGGGSVVKEAAPASSDVSNPPDWALSIPSEDGIAYGVGSAEVYTDPTSALNRAQDQARTELIKQLEVTISGETVSSQSRSMENGQSRVTRSIMDTVRSQVQETELANIEIAESHVDREGGTAYALARLDRTRAEMDLIGELKATDKAIREIEQAPAEGSRLEQLRALMPALPLLAERESQHRKLSLVATGKPGHRKPADFRRLESRVAELLDSLVVVLQPRGEGSRKLDSTLRRALSDEGVQVRESGDGDLELRYEGGLRTVKRDGRYFVFADGNTTVMDRSGRVIAEFQERVKAGSVDPDVARDRAIAKLADGLGEKLAGSLLESFARAGV